MGRLDFLKNLNEDGFGLGECSNDAAHVRKYKGVN